MKFSAQRLLLSSIIGKVSPFLVKGSNPHDPGQYLQVECNKDNISVRLVRPEVVAVATIACQAVDGLAKVSKAGKCVVTGKFLASHFEIGNMQEMVDLELVESSAPKKPKKSEDPGEPLPESIGKLSMTYSGAKGRKDKVDFSCVDIPLEISLEVSGGQASDFPASVLVKYGKMVGIAAGGAQMNVDFSQVLLKSKGKKAELVTCNGQQLSVASMPELTGSKSEYVLPYGLFATMLGLVDVESEPDRQSIIRAEPAKGKRVILSQSIKFGGKDIGKFFVSLPLGDKFIKYEDKIEKLDLKKFSCKAKKADLATFCGRLNAFDISRSYVSYDPKSGIIAAKKSDQNGEAECFVEVEADGDDGAIDLVISSRHISAAVSAVSGDNDVQELGLSFSGKRSLAMITMGNDVRQYFAPFTDE